jgi:cell division control protein 6
MAENTVDVNKILFSGSVFLNPDAVLPGYKPKSINEVMHRVDFIEAYTTHFKKTVMGFDSSNLLVFGKTGTGKTMVTKLMMQVISEAALQNGIEVFPVFVNCNVTYSDTMVLRFLITQFEEKLDLPHEKLVNNFSEYYNRLTYLMTKYGKSIIIIFDEIDKLTNPDIINNFLRIKENDDMKRNVCIVGISNSLYFTKNLDPRTKSALSQTEITVEPYDAVQLEEILCYRAKLAFKDGVIDDMVIPLCAALAAQEHGDARRAIDLLRVSGDIADMRGDKIIQSEHVREANTKIDSDKTKRVVTRLTPQSKTAFLSSLLLLNKPGTNTVITSDIYNVYLQVCEQIGIDVLSARRFNDLIGELSMLELLYTKKTSRGRGKGVVNMVGIDVNLDSNIIFDWIYEDSQFYSMNGRKQLTIYNQLKF